MFIIYIKILKKYILNQENIIYKRNNRDCYING